LILDKLQRVFFLLSSLTQHTFDFALLNLQPNICKAELSRTMMSVNLDEKRLPSEDEKENANAEHEFHDNVGGHGTMPDDPDTGLSVEERAAIVRLTIRRS
jgi:hypothetical protein